MSHGSEPDADPPFVNLTYCLWLPAGKDEFGFEQFNDAPLSRTALHRRQIGSEDTIASHFEHMAKRLRTNNMLAFMDTSSSLAPMDGELGLRKIHVNFTYHHNYGDFGGYLRPGPIRGDALFLSNGVYLWSFRMPLKDPVEGELDPHLKEIFQGFLRDDFVSRHVGSLFNFGWNPGRAENVPQSYDGILTYYQLDLLFNGVFDQSAHPHLSLGDQQPPEVQKLEDQAKERYDIEYLIKSFSLCVVGNEYVPLFDQRKSYTLRRTHGDGNAYVDTTLSLAAPTIPSNQEDELHRREIFLSRVSFAAMEQFLRVGISFGLIYYKTGLDHIRAELISQGMERRKNHGSGELRRPSLSGRSLTLADMEAYYALLAGKVPILTFLRDLIEGMSEVSRPAMDPETSGVKRQVDTARGETNGARGAVEWRFSRATLEEARSQFGRQVNAIIADLTAIQSSLDAVRSELMLLELTEARKLSEMAAETPRSEVELGIVSGSVKIDSELEKRLTLLFTFYAGVIAVLDFFTNVGLALSDKAFQGGWDLKQGDQRWMVGYWSLVGAAVLGAVLFGRKRLFATDPEAGSDQEPTPRGGEQLETHVFDYSSLSRRISRPSTELMRDIQNSMIDIEDPTRKTQKAARFSTFHEIPSGGIERVKYSLGSQATAERLTYILHIEFDRRISSDRDERLLDIRLVVRRPLTAPDIDIATNSRHVIGEAVEKLLSHMPKPDMRVYTRQHFGWEWPMTPAGGA